MPNLLFLFSKKRLFFLLLFLFRLLLLLLFGNTAASRSGRGIQPVLVEVVQLLTNAVIMSILAGIRTGKGGEGGGGGGGV